MKTIKCKQAGELLSPLIDGVISLEDKILLQEHLTSCNRCSAEYEAYKKISAALKQIPQATCRDPDFSKNVITLISGEQHHVNIRHRLTVWKKGVTAAAAAALIFAGALSMANNVPEWKIVRQDPNSISRPELPQMLANNMDEPDEVATDNPTAGNGAIEASVEQTEPAVKEQPANGEKTSTPVPVTPDNKNNVSNPDNATTETVTSKNEPTPVLLSSNLVKESTVLKLAVDNAEQTRAQAEALAASANGKSHLLSNQSSENRTTVVILQLLVDKQEASRVLNGIAGLGTIIDRQEDKRNVTAQHNTLAARYNALAVDTGDQAKNDERASIKQELDLLAHNAKNYTIMLTLIQKQGE